MRAEIVTTGTELLLGQIDDTNATYLARQLRDLGIDLFFRTTVGDNQARTAQALEQALARADLVITTGGLGPTVEWPRPPAGPWCCTRTCWTRSRPFLPALGPG